MTDTKTNTKKPVQSKVYNLKTAMLEFQKLALSATKGGKANIPSQGGKRTYARLEDVIEAVAQGNQFGLYFTQEIDFVSETYTESNIRYASVVVVTTVRHINDETTYVSKLPIIMSQQNMENPQKIGSAITYAKRYTLQAVYGLPSEDDDGQAASEPTIKVSNSRKSWHLSEGVKDDGL